MFEENRRSIWPCRSGLTIFRVSVYRPTGTTAMVCPYHLLFPYRHCQISTAAGPAEDLPGGARPGAGDRHPGSGKSSTLAAMIDYIQRDRNLHIITIEDPVEFLHRDNSASSASVR